MENIENIIGADYALQLSFDSRFGPLDLERWTAILRRLEYDDNGEEVEQGVRVASATLVRVDLESAGWFGSLDAESGDLAAVGAAFHDRSAIADVDPDSIFSESLLIVDFVGVGEDHRGSELSHALIHGIARIFRSDIVALVPASLSTDGEGGLFVDEQKREALLRHWRNGGFVEMPGTDVLVLPLLGR